MQNKKQKESSSSNRVNERKATIHRGLHSFVHSSYLFVYYLFIFNRFVFIYNDDDDDLDRFKIDRCFLFSI